MGAIARIREAGAGACALLAIAVATCALLLPAQASAATSVSRVGCAAGSAALVLSAQGPPTASTQDCAVGFGSDAGTAMLRVTQADGGGAPMFRPPTGALDPDFDGPASGNGAFTLTPNGADSVSEHFVEQPDGKLVLVTGNSSGTYSLVRLNPNGTYDTGWNGTGIATLPAGTSSDTGTFVALQPDGKVLVSVFRSGANLQYTVLRYRTDGTLDPTFDGDPRWSGYPGNGMAMYDCCPGWDEWSGRLQVQPDGRIVAIGSSVVGFGDSQWLVMRLDPNGALDRTFSGDGYDVQEWSNSWDVAATSVTDAAGRLWIIGNANGDQVTSLRYLPNGTLDTSYSGNGKHEVAVAGALEHLIRDAALQPDGKLIAVGSTSPWTADKRWFVARFNPDGSLDTTFSNDGTTNGYDVYDPSTGNDSAWGIALDPLGRAVVAGRANNDILVMRYTTDGTRDASFGTGGMVTRDFAGANDHAMSVKSTRDGTITVAGGSIAGATESLALVRLDTETIGSYQDGTTDWDQGGGAFGMCVRDVNGLGVAAGFGGGGCALTDGPAWRGLQGTGSAGVVARSLQPGVTEGTASLRFGLKSGSAPGGQYIAPLAVEVIAPNLTAPTNTGPPTISGRGREGAVLSAVAGTWTGASSPARTYRWLSCDAAGANCTAIPGATSTTFIARATDVGRTIRVEESATNAEGTTSAQSAQLAIVAATATSAFHITGFEHQTLSNGGTMLWSVGTPTIDTGFARTGAASLRSDGSDQVAFNMTTPGKVVVSRSAFFIDDMPTGGFSLFEAANVAESRFGRIYVQPGGQAYSDFYDGPTLSSQGVAAGPVLQEGRWYVLDVRVDISVNTNWRVDWRVDGVAQPQSSWNPNSADNLSYYKVGMINAGDGLGHHDDLIASTAAGDYPIGDGRVVGLLPNGIGAHNTPTNYRRDNNSAAPGFATNLVGDTDSHLLIDDWPVQVSATGGILQQNGVGGQLQYQLQDSGRTVPPNGIQVYGAHREASAGANNVVVGIRNGTAGTAATAYQRDPGGAVQYFMAPMATAPGGAAWTAALLDNLVLTLGETPNATPFTRTDALLVEADFPATPAPRPLVDPSYSGIDRDGEVLTADPGVWENQIGPFAYQWLRCDNAGTNCLAIPAATSQTYTLTGTDVRARIRVQVTGTNAEGSQSVRSAAGRLVAVRQASIVHVEGFESATISAQGGGLQAVVSGNVTSSTTASRSGNRSLLADGTGAPDSWVDTPTISAPVHVVRAAVRWEALPSATEETIDLDHGGDRGVVRITPAGQLQATASASGGTWVNGPVVEPHRWYVFDLRYQVGGNPWTLDWSVDGIPQPSTSAALAFNGNVTHLSIGSEHTVAFIDDIAISHTAADYPLGPGEVKRYLPNSTGAHSLPANFSRSTNNGGAFTSFTGLPGSDSNQTPGTAAHLDDWPVDTTAGTGDLVQFDVNGGWVQYHFENQDEATPPRAARLVAAHREAGAGGANTLGFWMRALGSQFTAPAVSPTANNATVQYFSTTRSAQPAGGAWTKAAFDDIHYGSASSVNTVRPWLDALLVEAEYPAAPTAVSTAAPDVATPGTTLRPGDVLRTDNGEWGEGGLAFSYAWYRCNTTTGVCAPIPNETAATYTVQAADAGSRLKSVVSADNGGGRQSAASASTGIVSPAGPTFHTFTGFEHGSTISANDVSDWRIGAPTMIAGAARTGALGMRCAPASGAQCLEALNTGAATSVVFRAYVRVESLGGGTGLVGFDLGGGVYGYIATDNSGVLQARFWDGAATQGFAAGTVTLVPGEWYLLDVRATANATHTLEYRVDGQPQPTSTWARGAADTMNNVHFGQTGGPVTPNVTSWDDAAVSVVAADYPLGPGRTYALRPDGAGTHATGTSFQQDDATALTAASWMRLADATVGPTTDHIRQTVLGAAAYAEWTMSDPPVTETAQAVRAIVQYRTSTAAAHPSAKTKVVRNGDTDAAAFQVHNGMSGSNFVRAATVTPPGPGWTEAELDALRVRTGYAGTVTPQPYWDATLLEVLYRG